MAYNAALQLASIALHASGYEATKGGGAHNYTIESLRFTLKPPLETIDALQAFRSKRVAAMYERTGIASQSEVDELRSLAIELKNQVEAWLKVKYPDLL
jgi:hypothetical protein